MHPDEYIGNIANFATNLGMIVRQKFGYSQAKHENARSVVDHSGVFVMQGDPGLKTKAMSKMNGVYSDDNALLLPTEDETTDGSDETTKDRAVDTTKEEVQDKFSYHHARAKNQIWIDEQIGSYSNYSTPSERFIALHRSLFEAIDRVPTGYRSVGVSVGEYTPPNEEHIPQLMDQLDQRTEGLLEESNLFLDQEKAIRFSIVMAVITYAIHPVVEGNSNTVINHISSILNQAEIDQPYITDTSKLVIHPYDLFSFRKDVKEGEHAIIHKQTDVLPQNYETREHIPSPDETRVHIHSAVILPHASDTTRLRESDDDRANQMFSYTHLLRCLEDNYLWNEIEAYIDTGEVPRDLDEIPEHILSNDSIFFVAQQFIVSSNSQVLGLPSRLQNQLRKR